MQNRFFVAPLVVIVLTGLFMLSIVSSSQLSVVLIQSRGTVQLDPPGKYSFIMSVSGATYQMLDGATGALLCQSTDSSKVFKWIIGNCSSNYKVYIKPGTYTVTSTWSITKSNLFFNFSTSTLVAATNLNNPVIWVYFVDNVTIVNATVDGNEANQNGNIWSVPEQCGIMVSGDNCLVTNCTIYSCRTYGVWFSFVSDNSGITNSYVYNADANGICLDGRYCYAYYNTVQGCADVLFDSYGNYSIFKYNVGYNTSGSRGYVNSYVGFLVETFYSVLGTVHDNVFADNTLYDCGVAIDVAEFAQNNVIENNTVYTDTFTDHMKGYWDSGDGDIFRNNTITGIQGTDGFNGVGLHIHGTNALVTNNTIQNCGSDGANVYTMNSSTISYNVFQNNGGNGITVWNCRNCAWLYNTVLSNAGVGISFTSPAINNLFANNTVSGNTAGNWYGMSTSTNSTFQGNIGLIGYQTLNITVNGNGSVSESCGTQSLSSISGNLWQFPTSSTIVLTAIHPSSSFYNFTFTNGTITTINPLSLLMNNNFDITANFAV